MKNIWSQILSKMIFFFLIMMGFHAVSFGHTKRHAYIYDFNKLIFKDIKYTIYTRDEEATVDADADAIACTFTTHDDILVNGKKLGQFTLSNGDFTSPLEEKELFGSIGERELFDSIDEKLSEMEFSIGNFHIGQGHCCCYGITMATVGNDCGGGVNREFSLEDVEQFIKLIKELHSVGRLDSTNISMTGNCCS